jgi:hypothetical protein
MFKGKLVVLSLIAAALCWQVMPASVNTANSGIVDACSSTASSAGGCWVVCPLGDGPALNALAPAAGDGTIDITVKDGTGAAVPGIPAADFWLVGAADLVTLCGGAGSINATAASDANGETQITGVWTAGGCDDGVLVVVQGVILQDVNSVPACEPLVLGLDVRSPDINGDLIVDELDFTAFGNAWGLFGLPYNKCADYDCDNDVDPIDFTLFGNHWGFTPETKHACN